MAVTTISTKPKYQLKDIDNDNYKVTVDSLVGIEDEVANQQKVIFGLVEKNRKFEGGSSDLPDAWKVSLNGRIYTFDKFGNIANINSNKKIKLAIKTTGLSRAKPTGDTAQTITNVEGSDVVIETRASGDTGGGNGTTSRYEGTTESGNPVMERLYVKDYFAMQAMSAMLNNLPNPIGINSGTIAVLTEQAYAVAQSMYEKCTDVRPAIKNVGTNDINKITASENASFDYIKMKPASEIDDMYGRLMYNQISVTAKLEKAIATLTETINKKLSPLLIDTNYRVIKNGTFYTCYYYGNDNNLITDTISDNDLFTIYDGDITRWVETHDKPAHKSLPIDANLSNENIGLIDAIRGVPENDEDTSL